MLGKRKKKPAPRKGRLWGPVGVGLLRHLSPLPTDRDIPGSPFGLVEEAARGVEAEGPEVVPEVLVDVPEGLRSGIELTSPSGSRDRGGLGYRSTIVADHVEVVDTEVAAEWALTVMARDLPVSWVGELTGAAGGAFW